jgi:hypothetical protein
MSVKIKPGQIFNMTITGRGKRSGKSAMIRFIKAGKNPVALVNGVERKVTLLGEDHITGDVKMRVNETGAVHFNCSGRLVAYKAA